jgi:hypothetical protein
LKIGGRDRGGAMESTWPTTSQMSFVSAAKIMENQAVWRMIIVDS